jgi:cobalamin biosynthesis Mg chelatase CobN
MAGNLTSAVATKQAFEDPDREDRYIGLLSGDYLMLPQKHTDELAKELPNLDLIQGYLVRKDADPNLPLQTRAESAVPGITYASMRISVQPLDTSTSSTSKLAAVIGSLSGSAAASKSSSSKSSSTSSSAKSSSTTGSAKSSSTSSSAPSSSTSGKTK